MTFQKIAAYLKNQKWVEQTCLALILANILSLPARFHWFFDLFVNFKIQYLTGAIILFILCLAFRLRVYALCMAILATTLFFQIQYTYSAAFAAAPNVKPDFTIVQYNKLFFNNGYERIGRWLRDPDNAHFDVVVINESLPDTIERLQDYKDVFPYQFPKTKNDRFGDLSILSKHPIIVERLPMPWKDRKGFNGSRILVLKKDLKPISIYAYHAQVPLGARDFARRNFEVTRMAQFAGAATEDNIILMGDWNLTPWSPVFKEVLETGGLHYQNFGPLPVSTWPSFNFLSALKIPIDHILFKGGLHPVSFTRGPSNGSDHHSLIARFYVEPLEKKN